MKAYIGTGCGIRKVTHDNLRNCDSSVYTSGNVGRGKVCVRGLCKIPAVRCEINRGNKHAGTQHCNVFKLILLCCTLFLHSTL